MKTINRIKAVLKNTSARYKPLKNQELITFMGSEKYNLKGNIIRQDGKHKEKIVILCHGLSSHQNNRTNRRLKRLLSKNKIPSFTFDFYGHGKSEGKFEDVNLTRAVKDILIAIKLLKKMGYKKIGLYGSSYGGASSIIAASKNKDLKFLILKAPVSDFYEKIMTDYNKILIKLWKLQGTAYRINSKGKLFKLNYTFFKDVKKYNGYEHAKKIKIPTLIIHGTKDRKAPLQQSIKTSKIIKNCELKLIQGANHQFRWPSHFKKMTETTIEFVIKEFKK